MNLQDFDRLLARHDWYYNYSDDHRVYSKGYDQMMRIHEARKLSSQHEHLYNAWVQYVFDGRDQDKLSAAREILVDQV